MIVWWFLFGSPFYSPYSGQLLWSEPYILETLFSTFHGLFFYAPVLLLVIPGLWQLRRVDGWTTLSLSLTWLALTYIVSINVAWWAGSSFGNRYFLTLTPFFMWGLAAFIKNNTKWAVALILPCVLWTVGLVPSISQWGGLDQRLHRLHGDRYCQRPNHRFCQYSEGFCRSCGSICLGYLSQCWFCRSLS